MLKQHIYPLFLMRNKIPGLLQRMAPFSIINLNYCMALSIHPSVGVARLGTVASNFYYLPMRLVVCH